MATLTGRPRLAVIMPAYNEAGNIGRAVQAVQAALPEADVIVINDGSADDTATLARQAGAIVLDLPHNLGIGGAVQTGYRFAAGRGYAFVARLDGDGQHDPSHVLGLLGPVLRGEADVVVGSRFVDPSFAANDHAYQASFTRAAGIRLYAWLVSRIIGQRVTDTTSGFQVCTGEAARFLADHCPMDYPEPEMMAALGRAGFRIREVPVQMRCREAGHSSITPLRSAYYALKVTLALLLEVLRHPALRPGAAQASYAAEGHAGAIETGVA